MGSRVLAVLELTLLQASPLTMARPLVILAFISVVANTSGARKLRGNSVEQEGRDERSLLNTFPFNARGGQGAHHNNQRQLFTGVPPRDARQSNRGNGNSRTDSQSVSFDEVAATRPGNDGRRCVDKVEMVEEVEYDEEVQCDHSYDRRCHTTYVTNYESQQEEECDENFRKTCVIEYETVAFNETVKVCRTPLVKDCEVRGPELCSTQYESECWTKNEEHEVEDDVVDCETVVDEKCEDETSGYTTNTKCSKWPREVCSVTK